MKRVRGKAAERKEPEAETRQRLLDAAMRLFSERGFRQVTVRDICREARANLAAVNYYYGDKLGLYKEIVQGVLTTVRRFDPAIEPLPGTSAEERIRHYVRVYLPQLAKPEGPAIWMQKLMSHEMQEPTPLAPWIAEQVIQPRTRYLSQAIAELLGCAASDPRVGRCVISLQAQCLIYLPNPFRRVALPGWRKLTDADLAEIAEHIAEFSLAGIARLAGKRARTPQEK